jgi:hypothetical protein
MTIGTAPVEETALSCQISIPMNANMTFIAEPRHADFEQPVIDGTVGFMAIRTIFSNRRMLMKVWASPLRMAGVAVLVDAVLLELRRIGGAVRVVAIGTGDFTFPQGHMGRAQELCLSLQVTLAAHFYFRSLVEERRLVVHLRELIPVRGLLHNGVAINAANAAALMRTCVPVRLHSPLMASQTNLILHGCRLSRVLAESDHSTHAPAPAGSDMVAAGSMAAFAGPPLCFIARIKEKYLSHHRLGKLLKLRRVTGLANFVADIGCRSWFGRLRLRRPDDLHGSQQHSADKTDEQ